MLNLALVALLAALQTSTTPQQSTAAQPELKGEACTARELVGTWQLASKPSTPGLTSVLKHVTPTHFFVVRLGEKDVAQSGHGGPYTVANGTYTETLAHGFAGRFEEFRGATISSSQCRINGDVWHVAGEYKGIKLEEQWRRVTGTSAER